MLSYIYRSVPENSQRNFLIHMKHFIASYLSLAYIFWNWLDISSVLLMNPFSKAYVMNPMLSIWPE